MRDLFAALLFCAAALAAPHAARGSGPVAVELFTSQGCSACPPADALLGELSGRPDVVALALHVDYWDYLGWRDVFASPANTRRQRAYVARLGQRSVFTPQAVVDGRASVVGSRKVELLEEIALAAAMPDAVSVALTRVDGAVRVALTPRIEGAGEARILFFVYERPQRVSIAGGENAARRLVYHNAVRDFWSLGTWRGGAMELSAPRPEDARGVAVLVQRRDGAILGAQKLEFEAAPISRTID